MPRENQPGLHSHHFHYARVRDQRDQTDAEADAQHRRNQAKQSGLHQYGCVQLALLRADCAQQRQRAPALRHQHLERVGDDQGGNEQCEHTEAQQEYGGEAGVVRAEVPDGLRLDRSARFHAIGFRQEPGDLVDGPLRGSGVGFVDVKQEHVRLHMVEIIHAVYRGDDVLRQHRSATVKRVHTKRVAGQANDAHVTHRGAAQSAAVGYRSDVHLVADTHSKLFGDGFWQRHLVVVDRLVAGDDADRQQLTVG